MATGRIGEGNTAIQPTIVDAKGDLIAATAADTPARLAVGSDGETLVADSSATTGLRWQGNYAAGKNKIINGDFGIWQRGTSFTTNSSYTADRFSMVTTAAQGTVSQQAFTPGTAPVAGYEAQYFLRYNATASNTDPRIIQPIEDVRTFAGQTVTLSFWAKSNIPDAIETLVLNQIYGSGGSTQTGVSASGPTLTSSWVRYSQTFTLDSISGKTIGTNSNLRLTFNLKNSAAFDFDVWGVQLEAGSTATAFQTATGSIQGELAACQRYYEFIGGKASGYPIIGGYATAGITAYFPIAFKVSKRVSPTVTKVGTWAVGNTGQPSPNYIGIDGFSSQQTATASGAFFTYPDSTDDGFTADAEL